jgi:GNAT superfamily N-acetyltransferase
MSISRFSPFRGGVFSLGYLFAADIPELEQLLASCEDYYEQLGYVPTPAAAAASLFECAPESGYANKFLLGVFLPDGELMGVVCVYRDEPAVGDWIIALMILHPKARGSGLGTEINARIERWARLSGARHTRVMVASQNRRGLAFWQQRGYDTLFENQEMGYGDARYTTIVMGRELPPLRNTGLGGLFPIWRDIPAVRMV